MEQDLTNNIIQHIKIITHNTKPTCAWFEVFVVFESRKTKSIGITKVRIVNVIQSLLILFILVKSSVSVLFSVLLFLGF